MRRDRVMGAAAAALAVALAAVLAAPASGQVATSCTASVITSFTPCLNFITGSTNGGGSPTQQCCKAVAGVVSSAVDCACLILTGNVPFGIPINRTLAISLTRFCGSTSVPLKCRDVATEIPAPGPIAFAPGLPPLPPMPPESSVDPTAISPSPVVDLPPVTQRQRPVVVPSSAWRSDRLVLATASAVLLVVAMISI